MAKVVFPDFIKSASGIISRKRMADGTIRSLVINKRGTMYEATFHRRTQIQEKEKANRVKFGIVSSACTIVRREMKLQTDPATRKQLFAAIGGIYDQLVAHGKTVTPEKIAELYAYMSW